MKIHRRFGYWRAEGRHLVRYEPLSPFVSPCQSTYDLNSTSPVAISNGITPTYIVKSFAEGPLHMFAILGSWRLDDAARENSQLMVRSKKIVTSDNQLTRSQNLPLEKRLSKSVCERFARSSTKDQINGFILKYGPQSFLMADEDRIIAYCASPEEAENLAGDFDAKYAREVVKENGTYVLIRETKEGIDTHSVALHASMQLNEDRLALHYGAGFQDWHRQFATLLGSRPHGISIFQGAPGTGKTSYIRHLLCELEATHRFYFMSPSQLSMLARPDFIEFWVKQTKAHPNRQFVVILEDAENAIMVRGTDNAKMVSTILNLTDGIMADFLKLQFICTINCQIVEIDTALLRPGRLLSHRNFRKLERKEALALASSIGKTLSENNDYTLAEIYAETNLNDPALNTANRTKIGFGA